VERNGFGNHKSRETPRPTASPQRHGLRETCPWTSGHARGPRCFYYLFADGHVFGIKINPSLSNPWTRVGTVRKGVAPNRGTVAKELSLPCIQHCHAQSHGLCFEI
ncbi:MAG: hypothetical protein ACREYC_18860, partial [Gammaproteobacteria bacterium]